MRYLWDMYEDYYNRAGLPAKTAMKIFKNPLRRYDLGSAENVDFFIANSRFVSERIKRIYKRESTVIHPPADVQFFGGWAGEKQDHYLLAGHLQSYKNPRLALDVFRRNGRRLIVAGTGPLEKELSREYGGKNITFTGFVSDETLRR